MDVAFFFFRKQQMENCHIFFPKVYHSGHYVLGMYSLNFCYHFYFFVIMNLMMLVIYLCMLTLLYVAKCLGKMD